MAEGFFTVSKSQRREMDPLLPKLMNQVVETRSLLNLPLLIEKIGKLAFNGGKQIFNHQETIITTSSPPGIGLKGL